VERVKDAILAEPDLGGAAGHAEVPPLPAGPEGMKGWLESIKGHPYVAEATRLVDAARQKGATTGNLYWDPDANGGAGDFTPERRAVHEKVAERILNPKAAAQAGETPTICFVMGAPGSGKTSQGRPAARAATGVPPSRVTTLDPDECKMALPEYRGWNAALLHDESGEVFDRIMGRAVEDRHHLVFDTTGTSLDFMKGMVDRFATLGYAIHIVHTHVEADVAAHRAAARFVKDAFKGTGHGGYAEAGRYVPVDWVYNGVDGKPERNFKALADDPRVSSATSYDATDLKNPKIRFDRRREEVPHLQPAGSAVAAGPQAA
jgi:adenylate kinase family enzyme